MPIGAILVYTLLAIALVGGWVMPFVSLCVYYFFVIWKPVHLYFWQFDPSSRFIFYLAVVTLGGWAISGFGDFSKLRRAKIPLMGLGIYLLMGLLGVVLWPKVHGHLNLPVWRARYAFELQVKIMIMGFVALSLVRSAKQIRFFALVLLAAWAYLAFELNYQWTVQGWNRVYSRGLAGIDNNGIGMIMAIGTPLAFFVGVYDNRWWMKLACFASAVLMVNMTFLTYSRGAQLGLAMIGVAIFLFAFTRLPNKGLTVVMAIVMVLVAMRLAGPVVQEEWKSIFVSAEERDASASSRFFLWKAAINCAMDYPLGVGPGQWKQVGHLYGTQGRAAHNLYFQTAAEYGIPGIMGLLTFLLGSFFTCFFVGQGKTARKLGWPAHYCSMCCVALGGYMVCGMFVSYESIEEGYIIAFLGLMVCSYVDRIARSGAMPDEVVPELEEVPRPGAADALDAIYDPDSAPAQRPEYAYV